MKRNKKILYGLCAAVVVLLIAAGASARTKLAALPTRDTMHLDLQHPTESLVTEERVLSLQKGNNHVDFSWQGVQIDSATIQFEVLDQPDKVRLISVAYPPGENALVWNVYSPEARQERVRIHYLLRGLERTVSYRQVVAADEKSAALDCRYRLLNRSGEDLSDARIDTGLGDAWTTALRDGEAREVTMFGAGLPVEKQYIYRAPSARKQTPLYYLVRNQKDWNLGRFKLPAGKMRFHMKAPSGSSIFLGEDWLEDLPVKEKDELTLGVARDVVVERQVYDVNTRVLRRTAQGRVTLSDKTTQLRYTIENFKDEPVTVKIVEPMRDNWEVKSLKGAAKSRWERDSNSELHLFIDLPAKGKKQIVDLVYEQKNQIN